MQIGDIVHLHPSQSAPGAIYPGTVEYIHPERRYYVVRFDFTRLDGKIVSFRESFCFPDRAGDASNKSMDTTEAGGGALRRKKKRK